MGQRLWYSFDVAELRQTQQSALQGSAPIEWLQNKLGKQVKSVWHQDRDLTTFLSLYSSGWESLGFRRIMVPHRAYVWHFPPLKIWDFVIQGAIHVEGECIRPGGMLLTTQNMLLTFEPDTVLLEYVRGSLPAAIGAPRFEFPFIQEY